VHRLEYSLAVFDSPPAERSAASVELDGESAIDFVRCVHVSGSVTCRGVHFESWHQRRIAPSAIAGLLETLLEMRSRMRFESMEEKRRF